ncbi:MAG: NAD(P)H-quinone oxidoreductase [Fimbriimonadaceae bacterium]|nr:NAD(P)H-quinone oxidoreductase [Fimbriimonadaceae bacterium]
MHAMLVDEQGALVWREVPDPVAGPGEVVINIAATALNRADLLQRAGNYPPPPGWPEWMGLEAAGTIAHAPADSRWRVGDPVCALLGGGGYAQQVAAPQELVLPVPAGLSLVEAAALPEAYATAYLNLCLEAGLRAGETVLIQAGASGLGTAAIQLVKALGGRVITTVGSAAKADLVTRLGADQVVLRGRDNLVATLAAQPPDIALDCVGGPELGPCLEQMAPGGRWVLIATLGGPRAELDVNQFFRRGLRLIGSTLRSRPLATKAAVLAGLEERLWPALASGALRPVIHRVLPITAAEEAHALLQRRENLGKVILTVPRP